VGLASAGRCFAAEILRVSKMPASLPFIKGKKTANHFRENRHFGIAPA
jgi:hypothetical protein